MSGRLTQFPDKTVPLKATTSPAGEQFVPPSTTAAEDLARLEEEKAERRRRKEAERADEARVLDPWERYRALSDQCDGAVDLTEWYDRKTRFALIILTGLNAMNLLVVTKPDAFDAGKHPGALTIAYLVVYSLISLYLFAYAIAALRPRRWSLEHPVESGEQQKVPGLRMTAQILDQSLDEYCENWRQVQVGSMNREMAVMSYMTAKMNAAKHAALHRVFSGLYVLVALTAALVIVMGYSALSDPSAKATAKAIAKQGQIAR